MELIYVFITAILFATLEPVSVLIASDISPLGITALRFLMGGMMLLPISIHEIKKQRIALSGKDHMKIMGLSVLFVCISMVMLQRAILLSNGQASIIAIVFSSNSVMTIFLSSILLKEKITTRKIVALLLCVLGIVICSWNNLKANSIGVSIILALLAAVTFSLYAVLNKRMMKKASGNILFGLSAVYGSIFVFIIIVVIALVKNQNVFNTIVTTEQLEMKSILIMLYIGIAVTGIGYWAYFGALKPNDSNNST